MRAINRVALALAPAICLAGCVTPGTDGGGDKVSQIRSYMEQYCYFQPYQSVIADLLDRSDDVRFQTADMIAARACAVIDAARRTRNTPVVDGVILLGKGS